jgi:hypothetical protein
MGLKPRVIMGARFWKLLVASSALLCGFSLDAAEAPAVCGVASDSCAASCRRFDETDARFAACNKFCRTRAKDRGACEVERPAAVSPVRDPTAEPAATVTPESAPASAPLEPARQEVAPDQNAPAEVETPTQSETPAESEQPALTDKPATEESPSQVDAPSSTQAPTEPVPPPAPPPAAEVMPSAPAVAAQGAQPARPSLRKSDMVDELEKNAAMIMAIRTGNLKGIRRLIQVQGLDPTFVFAYEFNPQTRQYDAKAARLRLVDIFSDTNVLRDDKEGLDKILSLFIELGLNVKATLPVAHANGVIEEKTAWGPSLKTMEPARDRAARMRAFEIALQSGLVPNSDFSDWLFAELPQVCGRDRSKFSIEVFELLLKYLHPAMQDPLWREGERGPETVADVLDRSFAPVQAKTAYERSQAVLLDDMWEQCTPLSRRISRFLVQNN